MGTLVLQPNGAEFCQQPVSLGEDSNKYLLEAYYMPKKMTTSQPWLPRGWNTNSLLLLSNTRLLHWATFALEFFIGWDKTVVGSLCPIVSSCCYFSQVYSNKLLTLLALSQCQLPRKPNQHRWPSKRNGGSSFIYSINMYGPSTIVKQYAKHQVYQRS